jgi:hypothetical protein
MCLHTLWLKDQGTAQIMKLVIARHKAARKGVAM